MKKWLIVLIISIACNNLIAQTPKTYTSSEILLQLKRLNVLGSVLYIAAHPDDENTRLLAYLANEKLYRTGYLSLTRGDGGQNLIGNEQGVDLGLIRTQELLAARRIDGAEQFFSRAYDFGFCKSTDEAIKTWGHDKILSDIVWVIRTFKPDVIITRFPGDSRAGHGHHSASAVLAEEAFEAAADSTKFPEQFKHGVTTWKPKRLLWNTFSFGSTNTTSEDQFKMDVGMYNPLLGKSYGEIAALSRSQHKSQGFGVPAQRGVVQEYFVTIKGEKPANDLFDNVITEWYRAEPNDVIVDSIRRTLKNIIDDFSEEQPQLSIPALMRLNDFVDQTKDDYWKTQKKKEIKNLIEICSGLFLEATTNTPYAVQGDSIKINFIANNRLGAAVKDVRVSFKNIQYDFGELKKNVNSTTAKTTFIEKDEKLTQPYWLQDSMTKGSFTVNDQRLIGKAENDPISAEFSVNINGEEFKFLKPVRYKFTDPVKGEIYQPLYIVPQITLSLEPTLSVFNSGDNEDGKLTKKYKIFVAGNKLDSTVDEYEHLSKLSVGGIYTTPSMFDITGKATNFSTSWIETDKKGNNFNNITEIDYDHIPSIKYFSATKEQVVVSNVITDGKNIGYIVGAGDKIPQALEQLGYKVTFLKEADIVSNKLSKFDAIVTGIRAYNTNEWLGNKYDVLMQYVKDGGTLLVQYNTNSNIGPVKIKISPSPFTISRNRITDEEAKIKFLQPKHPVLNYPNKITEEDFEDWIQERSIYNAVDIDSSYQRIIAMKDPGEDEQDGSLIVTDYGKGRFIYTGLVFFRELPAGVPGAYRLFANLIAKRKK